MLFNSFGFIFLFLPLTWVGYFFVSRYSGRWARLGLVLASLFFYGWWDWSYVPLLVFSALVNYGIGTWLTLTSAPRSRRKSALLAGLVWNVGLLAYFKYAGFFVENLNGAIGTSFPIPKIVLPLAISFFTFQKIAFLVDCYKKLAPSYGFINYLLFVAFFPQLIAGPIVHHREILSQFEKPGIDRLHLEAIVLGVFTFVLGLGKKVLIADGLAVWANNGFNLLAPNFVQGWAMALAYTFQLYFDFSGYTDMAIGSALLFNIKLPENFLSPYQALTISDFWKRWHATLGKFLRDYVYIPLGGNRGGALFTSRNLLLTFLIGGFWHGADWTFVLWGLWHGVGVAAHARWEKCGKAIPHGFAWGFTFLFVVFGWVMFRAKSVSEGWRVWKSMVGLQGMGGSFLESLKLLGSETNNTLEMLSTALLLLLAAGIAFRCWNTAQLRQPFRPRVSTAVGLGIVFVFCLMNLRRLQEFLYFNF